MSSGPWRGSNRPEPARTGDRRSRPCPLEVAAGWEPKRRGRLLAAVDLSPMSPRVADRARMLVEAHQAELKLVDVVEPPDVPLPDKMLERIHLYR